MNEQKQNEKENENLCKKENKLPHIQSSLVFFCY